MRIAIGALVLLAIATLAHADIIYVDIDATGASDGTSWGNAYVDLQDALNAAVADDEVWVAEGTYRPSGTGEQSATFSLPSGSGLYGGFDGSELSLSDRDWQVHVTVLDGQVGELDSPLFPGDDLYHVVTVIEATPDTVFGGFVVRGGHSTSAPGGGILVQGGEPTFRNLVVESNRASTWGAGIGVVNAASPTFSGVMVRHNFAAYHGGGVYVSEDSAARFVDSAFESNFAEYGGGVYGYGNAEFVRVDFTGNTGDEAGGGVFGGGTFEDVLFENNDSTISNGRGGGVAGRGTFTNVIFRGNRGTGSSGGGGGLWGSGRLANVVFEANGTVTGGGGMFDLGDSELVNVLFIGNAAQFGGGYVHSSSLDFWEPELPPGVEPAPPSTLVNVTFYGNSAAVDIPDRHTGDAIFVFGGSVTMANAIIGLRPGGDAANLVVNNVGQLTFRSSDVLGSGGSGADWNAAFGVDLGGNIDLDPLFVNAAGGDFHLTFASPAINAGDTSLLPEGLLLDLDGNPRVIGPDVDMGAYESPYVVSGAIIYVDADATGGNTGTSWADAYTDLQDALAAAVAGQEVWIAEGLYLTTSTGDRAVSFELVNGVRAYGGFAGSETTRNERDPSSQETVLSGRLGESPGSWSDAVVKLTQADSTTIADGVTIQHGAKGVLIAGGNPRLSRFMIRENLPQGESGGGGVEVTNGGRPIFVDGVIRDNHSRRLGGGINASFGGPLRLEHVLFEGNVADIASGGMQGVGILEYVEFRGNQAEEGGGGLTSGHNEDDTILHCVSFINNYSNGGGAGMAGRATFLDVQFVGNKGGATDEGGGLFGGGVLVNVLFDSNEAYFGGGMYDRKGGSTLVNVAFLNNWGWSGSALIVSERPPPLWSYGEPAALLPTSLINVTVAGFETEVAPHADWDPAAIIVRGSGLDVANSIIWSTEDHASANPPVAAYDASLSISHSLVQRSGGSHLWDRTLGTDLGGNLDVDPLFVDAGGGNFRLAEGSPAIDAGDTYAVPEGVRTDLDGNPRFMRSAVDMGAYEADGPLSLDDPDPVPQPKHISRYLYAAPNPFNPSTTIYYGVPDAGHVTLTIYDMAGRKVKALVAGHVTAGDHEVSWDGRDEAGKRVASGVYLYRLTADEFVESKRMVLVK